MTPHDVGALKERLKGRKVVASVSGGKDSAAMSLYLSELGIEHERVFMDTNWEHADTYRYLRGPLTEKLGAITELKSDEVLECPVYARHQHELTEACVLCKGTGTTYGMVALILRKGMFPARVRRFCTQELKLRPLFAYLNKRADEGEDTVSAVGIRRAESQARANMPEWEWAKDLDAEVWRPLVLWTFADVVAIHQRHGLSPNPLYLRGAERVGCWPCIFARKDEIRFVADNDPDRIALIRALEHEVEIAAAARYAAKGETFESRGLRKPTFFVAPNTKGAEEENRCWPIDRMVAWSRTARGGQTLAPVRARARGRGLHEVGHV